MSVLVTGASGFIGKHLMYSFRKDQVSSYGIDLQFLDLTDPDSEPFISKLIRDRSIDTVVHLAAVVGRVFGEDDVSHTIAANTIATAHVARATAEAGARLVYISTSEVYGDQDVNYVREHTRPVIPHNLYGLTKRWGEEVSVLYAPEGLQVIRLSMPYGPGLPAGRGRAAIINMLWQAYTGRPIPVHRGAMRSWCWIGDTIRGIRAVIDKGDRIREPFEYLDSCGIYNVGSDTQEVSMQYVAEYACRLTGADPSLIYRVDAPSNQTVVKRLSMKKLKDLGWSEQVSLELGMEMTLDFIKRNHESTGGIRAGIQVTH
jgi:nucleoside-diphosphate-sugar epimerase